jgi:hypothetical protein
MVDGQCSVFPLRDVLVASIKWALVSIPEIGRWVFLRLPHRAMKNEDTKADKMSNGSKMMSVERDMFDG